MESVLSQNERWEIWQQSLGKRMGCYPEMRNNAELSKLREKYQNDKGYIL